MLNEIRKIKVFIIRDLRMLVTYKLAYTTTIINMIFTFLYLILFGSMFQTSGVAALQPYGGDFVAYVLIGSMGWSFIWNITNSVSFSLRNEMLMGTLESILLTPTKIHTIMISYIIFGSIFGLLSMAILFIVGFLGFGVTAFSSANIFTLIIFALSIIMMSGLGMIIGGATLRFKHIGQTIPLIQGIAMFFCGVYFPITILPASIQKLSKFIPFYYSIEGMRLSLTIDELNTKLYSYILILILLSVTFIILGAVILNKELKRAKKQGNLAFY